METVSNEDAAPVFLMQRNFLLDDSTFVNAVGFDPSHYIGYEVTHIDGVPVAVYLQNWADEAATYYKSGAVRKSAAMMAFGPFTVFSAAAFRASKVSVSVPFTYVDALGTSRIVDVPFMAAGPNMPIADLAEFESFNKPQTTLVPMELDIHKEFVQRHLQTALQITGHLPHLEAPVTISRSGPHEREPAHREPVVDANVPPKRSVPSPTVVPVLSGNASELRKISEDFPPYPSLILYKYRDTFVLQVTTFSPVLKSTTLDYIANTLLPSFCALNVTRLVVDVSRNGGGDLCLTNGLLAALVPEWVGGNTDHATSAFRYNDLRETPLEDMAVSYGVESPVLWLDPATGMPPEDPYFYTNNTVERTRGCVAGRYSASGWYWPHCAPSYFAPYAGCHLDRLLVLSEGTCGSACSQFVSHLQSSGRARILTYGGDEASVMDGSSFAGGNVMIWQTYIAMFEEAGVPADQLPPVLPTSASARFNNHESYYGSDYTVPREFYLIPGDYHAYDWAAVYSMGYSSSVLADLYETAVAVLTERVPDGLLAPECEADADCAPRGDACSATFACSCGGGPACSAGAKCAQSTCVAGV
eukprot:TRINITY_DN89_c1_g3_i4.p1 TRINITY_DN89_c1_g3~~TRINITY_DN89_c1_g3_i4.p1  ORF type:complete len:586 (+),score=82.25 TRINITY_DN89_c1_g3_i4:488-2245(+)